MAFNDLIIYKHIQQENEPKPFGPDRSPPSGAPCDVLEKFKNRNFHLKNLNLLISGLNKLINLNSLNTIHNQGFILHHKTYLSKIGGV